MAVTATASIGGGGGLRSVCIIRSVCLKSDPFVIIRSVCYIPIRLLKIRSVCL